MSTASIAETSERRPKAPAAYLPALTGLRFCLAVWVILNHITGKGMMLEEWAQGLPSGAYGLIRGGYLAVQTFFLLSGFVLAQTYARITWNRVTLGRFAVARFARIYPVYLLSLVIVSPFAIEMMVSPPWTVVQRAKLISIYILVLQGWTGSLAVGWNTPAWTLTCEFFFYLCFPLLFAVLRNARWRMVVAAMAVAIVMPVALDHSHVTWELQPLYNIPDFIAGIVASRIFTLLAEKGWWRGRGYYLYLPGLIIAGWLIIHPNAVNGTGAAVNEHLRPLNALILAGLALSGGWLARLLSTRPMDFLGKASYSMYVLHVPILWWYGRYYVHGKLHPSKPFASALYLAIVIAVSGFVYQWFEAPASDWLRGRRR